MKDMSGSEYETAQDLRFVHGKTQRAPLGLRFAHGATFQLKSDSLSDYLLAPIFLKFLAISVAMIVLLKDRPHATEVLGLTSIVQWVAVTGGTLLCLFCLGAVCVSLKNVGVIKTIYTPIVCLPSVLLTEYFAQELLVGLWGLQRLPMETSLVHISRMCGVVILLDILYGSFVAPVHPQTLQSNAARLGRPQRHERIHLQAGTAQEDGPSEEEMAPAFYVEPDVAMPQPVARPTQKIRIRENIRPTTLMRPSVMIGAERVYLDSLIQIRAEDHYLRVVTLQSNQMIRGKLATVIEKLDTDLGVQVNRSVWVARAQISYAQVEDSRRMSLILGNGDEVVVARPRLTLVKDCLRRWNIDLRDGVVSGTDATDLDQAS
jgi:hypothetical protein